MLQAPAAVDERLNVSSTDVAACETRDATDKTGK